METKSLLESFPEIIVAISELGITLVTFSHDPDLQQMQSKVNALLKEGLIYALFVSNDTDHTENAIVQEKLMRECITLLMTLFHDPDKEVMLSHFHQLLAVPPERIRELAREQGMNMDVSDANQSYALLTDM